MTTPLAWKNLSHNKVRTAVALAGVSFAVILIFMQLGFKGAVRKTATQIYDALDFDLMLRSPAYLHLTEPMSIPRERVFQAASAAGVEHARPFYLGLSEWQAPLRGSTPAAHQIAPLSDATLSHGAEPPSKGSEYEGQWRGIITIGIDPNDPAFVPPGLREKSRKLTDSRFVLIDAKSKKDYGPRNGKRFGPEDIGVTTKLGSGPVQIVDFVELGTGLAANGACIANYEGFASACPWQPLDQINFGLLKLAPGADVEKVKREVQALVGHPSTADAPSSTPADVRVLTRAEVNAIEEYRWVVETPIGQIFNFGVWVAVFVGVAIVYQVLSTDIANMMSEYATLKAMGYSNKYLTSVVLQQAVLLALVGYVPSIAVSWALYKFVGTQSGMPMAMTPQIAVLVLVLAVVMCVLSAMAALRKLYQADPADLF